MAKVVEQFLPDGQLRVFPGDKQPAGGIKQNRRTAEDGKDNEANPHRGDVDAEEPGNGPGHPGELAVADGAARQSNPVAVGAIGRDR